MKAWKIFVHSVRQVVGNLGAALRVSGLLYVVQFVLLIALQVSVPGSEADIEAAIESGNAPWASMLLVIAVTILTSLWIAVAWHRYVLIVEEPGVLPAFHGARMGAYFVKGLLIGLILLVPAALLAVIAGTLGGAVFGSGVPSWKAQILMGLILLPVAVIALRLSSVLPGVALGEETRLGKAWEATRGQSPAFAGLAVIWSLATFLMGAAAGLVAAASPLLGLVAGLAVGWATTMIGVSMLTTLYGHYIQGRALV